MTAAQRDYRERQVARRNREDLSVLLELRDIEDELSTILKLLDQQDTVIQSMVKYFNGGYGKSFLDTAQGRIEEYRSQISEMKENSHLTQKAVCIRIFLHPGSTTLTNPTGRNPPRPQAKAGKCRRSQNGPLASRSHPDPVSSRNGIHHIQRRVSLQTSTPLCT
jgi:hypothetical protein